MNHAFTVIIFIFACSAHLARADRPNVIIMLADDAGYSDFSCFGSEHIRTPHVDQLAAEGVRFTDFYAAAPNCSPSRTGLLTGRSPTRVGVYSYIDEETPVHLPASEVTIAELLKDAGYQTAVFGKWHLNDDIKDTSLPQPNDHGFDYWFCTRSKATPSHLNPNNFFRNGEKLGVLEGYACQIVIDDAINWIEHRDPERPFFAYIPFNEPHTPIASPPELVAQHPDFSKKKAEYFANIENLDSAIGRLMQHLDQNNLRDDTLVIFYSDNGGVNPWSNRPLRGKKSFVWDGGIRVPCVMRWPGHTIAGQVISEPASGCDILPTVCAEAEIELPTDRKIDGVSLLPLFTGQAIERETPLFWYFYRVTPAVAMREGDWKIVGYLERGDHSFKHAFQGSDMPYVKEALVKRFELYNIRDDIDESNDLSAQYPQLARVMSEKLIALHHEVVGEGVVWDFSPK